MSAKIEARFAKVAPAVLQPGETVGFATFAAVGRVSVKRQLATAAVVGVLSAGTISATVQPKPFYVVVTDQRLLVVEPHPMFNSKVTEKVVTAVPRGAVTLARPRHGLAARVDLAVDGWDKGLSLAFGIQRRGEAAAFAKFMAAPAPQPTA